MRKLIAGLLVASSLMSAAFAGSPHPAIAADGLGFPEGTILVNGVLYFVDYQASTVNRLDGASYTAIARLPECGSNGLVAARGDLWVACYDSGAIARISMNGAPLGTLNHSRSGDGFIRPNDLVANRHGGIYFTASGDRPGNGKVFFLASSSDVAQEVASGIDNANGIALSPDGKTLYVGESGADRILSYQISQDGSLHSQRTFAQLDSLAPPSSRGRHTPDGVRIGPDGLMYVALFNGGGYWVLDKNGALLKAADVPGDHHSNLAVSADGHAIYVTSVSGISGRIYLLPLALGQADRQARTQGKSGD